jgi:hypothetical protein
VYYAIYQILQLAGEIPNGELENGNISKQFIRCLTNIGWFKYDSSIAYKRNSIIINTINNITKIYRSQKDNNTDPLPNVNTNNNNSSWANIITINEDNTVVFNTVSSDNTGVFMGSFMYGVRRDTPEGWLRCDGNEYPANSYQNFIDQYMITEKIPSITLGQYEEELNKNNDNCGYFGYDETNNILRVPKLDDRVAIMQALTAGNIAKYNQDQIVNITGSFVTMSRNNTFATDGAFYKAGEGDSQIDATQFGATFGFDASRVVNTGDRVQPRHIQYPLFVCVSNQSQPITEDNVNLFIEGLNNKASIDGNNVTETFFTGAILTENTVDYVVETYKNGESWYRKYKSGWIEQGGLITNTGTSRVVTLRVSMSDNMYDVQLVPMNMTATMYQLIVNSRNTNNFTIYASSSGSGNSYVKWSVRGFIQT